MKKCNFKIVFIIVSVQIILLNSCKDTTCSDHLNNIAKKFIGKAIYIPDSMSTEFSLLKLMDFAIITYIDSSECTICSLERIKQFSLYDFNQLHSEILLVIRVVDENKTNEILNNLCIDYPVIYDRNGEFREFNYFLNEPIFKTFVIDKQKNIIWMGLPIETSKTWKLFNKMIKNYYVCRK